MGKFLTGKLLIASPYLPDDNFSRTVCYIVRHDEEGAFGLILNRPIDLTLSDVLEETLGKQPLREDSIYLGGPVEGPLCALHRDGNFCDLECKQSDLFVTSDQESLMVIANQPETEARFFAGYSGWSAGQLEAEMNMGGWLVCEAEDGDLFADPNNIWEDVVKRIGQSIINEIVPTPVGSVDPSLN